ncbi:GpE family phage tail protein [Bartonella sp. DGB2]
MFHWPLSELLELTPQELVSWHEWARKRLTPPEPPEPPSPPSKDHHGQIS